MVLITDGYDENSTRTVEDALARRQSRAGDAVRRRHRRRRGHFHQRGARAAQHSRSSPAGAPSSQAAKKNCPHIHDLIAADIQQRYLLAYTPTNQQIDGGWRTISLRTSDATHRIRTRPGYFAPEPPPVRATVEFTLVDRRLASRWTIVGRRLQGASRTACADAGYVSRSGRADLDRAGGRCQRQHEARDRMRQGSGEGIRDRFAPEDQLALLMFSDQAAMVHDLTTKRRVDADGPRQYKATGGTALNDALVQRADAPRIRSTADGRLSC